MSFLFKAEPSAIVWPDYSVVLWPWALGRPPVWALVRGAPVGVRVLVWKDDGHIFRVTDILPLWWWYVAGGRKLSG